MLLRQAQRSASENHHPRQDNLLHRVILNPGKTFCTSSGSSDGTRQLASSNFSIACDVATPSTGNPTVRTDLATSGASSITRQSPAPSRLLIFSETISAQSTYPSASGLPLFTSSAETLTEKQSRKLTPSSIDSISSRSAPEQMASG